MYSFLALGDSYTIGEGVLLADSFPYQTLQLLRERGLPFSAPEIVAKTGDTTGELISKIAARKFLPGYDIVTLLIGVNNQYRGLSPQIFETEFDVLLKQAISFAGGHADHMLVLSIPDWGQTPFAAERDREKIGLEIDAYNAMCRKTAQAAGAKFIDITESYRRDIKLDGMLADDGLHPSAEEYKKWAELVCDRIISLHSFGTDLR